MPADKQEPEIRLVRPVEDRLEFVDTIRVSATEEITVLALMQLIPLPEEEDVVVLRVIGRFAFNRTASRRIFTAVARVLVHFDHDKMTETFRDLHKRLEPHERAAMLESLQKAFTLEEES